MKIRIQRGKKERPKLKLSENVYLVGSSSYGLSSIGDCNVYLIDCGEKQVLIDSGDDPNVERILQNISNHGFDTRDIELIINTHCHCDHIGGNAEFKKKTGCRLAAFKGIVDEIEAIGELILPHYALRRGHKTQPSTIDIPLEKNEIIRIGNKGLQIIHTPGHSPGGIMIIIKEERGLSIFTGDTVPCR